MIVIHNTKLFAVLTGQTITDDDEDRKMSSFFQRQNSNQTVVSLGNDLKLPPDYFQFIIDECHRSIYGKWQSVLNYFKGATIWFDGNTPEAYAFSMIILLKNILMTIRLLTA